MRTYFSFPVNEKESHFWTSGTSLLPDSKWVWLSTGESVVFHNWLPSQPDNAGNNEKCLEVIFNPDKYTNLIWNDNNCVEQMYTICETYLPRAVSNFLATQSNANLTLIDVRTE